MTPLILKTLLHQSNSGSRPKSTLPFLIWVSTSIFTGPNLCFNSNNNAQNKSLQISFHSHWTNGTLVSMTLSLPLSLFLFSSFSRRCDWVIHRPGRKEHKVMDRHRICQRSAAATARRACIAPTPVRSSRTVAAEEAWLGCSRVTRARAMEQFAH